MKKVLILMLLAFSITGVYAQHASFTLSYPISFPMGNLNDYISEVSFRGVSMEFNKRQKPNLDIGMEIGWNVFYQREDSKTYTEGTSSVSGVQYRNTNAVPMIVGAKWYRTKGKEGGMEPYIGFGLGVTYVERATDFGLYRLTTDGWQFCLRPEAGLLWQFNPGMAAMLGVKYYANFETEDLDGQPYLSVNVGLVFSR